MQTFEDTIYQFVACKNHVLFVLNSDNQRGPDKTISCCSFLRMMQDKKNFDYFALIGNESLCFCFSSFRLLGALKFKSLTGKSI